MDDPSAFETEERLACAEERIRRLEAVVEASVRVNSTLDLRELAEYVIEIAANLIGAERGSLFLVDHQRGTLQSLVAQGLNEEGLDLEIGDGIVGAVAASGEAMILNDPYVDPRFDSRVDLVTGFRTRSLLTVPVVDRDETLVAVLQLLNHLGAGFSTEDVDFLAELGVTFAIALTTARLHREIVTRERMQEELRLAAEIQETLRPHDHRSLPGLEVRSLVQPCLEVGGDYFDLIPRDDDRWWLVMADISGKGVAAGLIASNVQAFLWSRRADERPLELIIAEANDLLCRLAQGRKFATLVLVEWTPRDRTIRWVNAGHPPMLLIHGNDVRTLDATGLPVGLLSDQSYGAGQCELSYDQTFVLYTDGVLEAGMGEDVGEFGLDRLVQCVTGAADAQAAIDAIEAAVTDHLQGSMSDDDLTILCGRCVVTGEEHR